MNKYITITTKNNETLLEFGKRKLREGKEWCKENKEMVVAITPVLLAGGFDLAKLILKQRKCQEERYLKEQMIYDRSKGHYVETRRKLKTKEWVEFDQRRNNGESVSSILEDMRLLK